VSRHEIHRKTRQNPGDFAPLFDWGEPPAEPAPETDAAERLRRACADWIEGGGLICSSHFGVDVVNRHRVYRGKDQPPGPLTGEYAVTNKRKYCDPFGALLHGRPYGAGILPDIAKILGVDEFWIVGFMHGLDGTDGGLTGRRADEFDESASYQDGLSAGRQIAEEFVRIQVGWERR
jgi:hypothetical protein